MHPIFRKRYILISAKCAQKTMRIYIYSLTYQIFCLIIRGVTYAQKTMRIYFYSLTYQIFYLVIRGVTYQ